MSAVVSPTASGISPANLLYRSRKRVNIFMLGVSGWRLAFGLFWLAWILGTCSTRVAMRWHAPRCTSR